jgi:hypothetical protein
MPRTLLHHSTRWMPALSVIVLLAGHNPARADLFLLENGGRIEGEWINREEQPLRQYLVRTRAGVTVTLPPAQVREAIRQSPAEAEYSERAPATLDTASAQWELAEWCRKNSLSEQRRVHLRRIIEHDPNHQQARRALGYQFLQGEWVNRGDFLREVGFEFYRGKWRTPQEIEILEEKARFELAEKEWRATLVRLRRDLDSDRARQAFDAFMAIKDPIAVRPLTELFSRERNRRVKMLYSDVLANINSSQSVAVLTRQVLNDPDEEIYHYCVDKLAQLDSPHIGDPFISALGSRNNAEVNRAAMALARLQDQSAISPLIEALITTHTQVLPGNAGPNATTTGFGSGGTILKQNEGPKVLVVTVKNQHVLDALTKLTGANFGFQQKAWRHWHAQERIAAEARQPAVDARRD